MNRPFKRIIRPLYAGHFGHEHLIHSKYCNERIQLLHAYFIIEKDFIKIMEYVELTDSNRLTYSHRIYELLLRVCTEFENNCKGILRVNGHIKSNPNITDYFLINKASKLNEYTVRINNWFPIPLEFNPFVNWSSLNYSPLDWYQAYNYVKHNRTVNFDQANLENLLKAIGGLFAILHSQYGRNAFHQFQATMMSHSTDDGFQYTQESVFSIKYPNSWLDIDTVQNVNMILETENETELFMKYNFNE